MAPNEDHVFEEDEGERNAQTSLPYGHCRQIGRLIFVDVCRAFGDAHQELQPEGEGPQTTSPAKCCVSCVSCAVT